VIKVENKDWKEYLKEWKIENPFIFLTIIMALSTVFYVLHNLFPNDPILIPILNMSIIGLWFSIIFKCVEIFTHIEKFKKMFKDSSEAMLKFTIIIQGISLLYLLWIVLSNLPDYFVIFTIGFIIILFSEYFVIEPVEKLYKYLKIRTSPMLHLITSWFIISVIISFHLGELREFAQNNLSTVFMAWITLVIIIIHPVLRYFYSQMKFRESKRKPKRVKSGKYGRDRRS
jgi:hypothetical protein